MPSVYYIQVLSCRKDQDVNQCFWLLTAKLTGNLALAIAHSVTDTSESPADDRPTASAPASSRYWIILITARSVWIQGWYSQKQYYWFSLQFSILWKGIHSLTLRRWRLIHLWRIVPGTRFSSGCPRSAQLVVCKHQSKTFAQRGNTDDLPHAWYTCDLPMPGMFPGSTDSSVASMWLTRDLGARPTLDSLV